MRTRAEVYRNQLEFPQNFYIVTNICGRACGAYLDKYFGTLGFRVDYKDASYGVCLESSHHTTTNCGGLPSTAPSTTSESCGVSGSSVASSSSTVAEETTCPSFSGWVWGRTQFGELQLLIGCTDDSDRSLWRGPNWNRCPRRISGVGRRTYIRFTRAFHSYRCVGAFSSASGDSNYIPNGGDYQLVGEYNSATKSVTAAYHQLIVMQRKVPGSNLCGLSYTGFSVLQPS